MRVYIVGGFLGSGKTTLLMRLASMYSERGAKTALLVNESGEVGVDGATLKAAGYDATELPNGCICCSLAGSLQTALRNIKADINPEIIIIEPTGMAFPHRVKTLVNEAMIDPETVRIIGIADVQKFDNLIKRREDFFKQQMAAADFILINKSDLATPEKMASAVSWLKEKYPDVPLIPVSVKTGENLEKIYGMMK